MGHGAVGWVTVMWVGHGEMEFFQCKGDMITLHYVNSHHDHINSLILGIGTIKLGSWGLRHWRAPFQ